MSKYVIIMISWAIFGETRVAGYGCDVRCENSIQHTEIVITPHDVDRSTSD